MAHRTRSSSKSKYRKAQFFIISAFTIVTILYFVSRWMEPYTIPDTSIVVWNDEPFILNNIIEKAKDTIRDSEDLEEMNYNLQEFGDFVKEYGLIKNLDIDFDVIDIIEVVTVIGEPTPADIMLVIDTSSSMDDNCPGGDANPGETPCGINDAKNAAKLFVDFLNSTRDKSGVAYFESTAEVTQILTDDKNDVKNAIESLSIGSGTNMGDGIRTSTEELMVNGSSEAAWYQIFLSDGRPTEPFGNAEANMQYAREAAVNASDEGEVIYTIGFGEETYINQTFLEELANITDGKYYYAATATELEEIYMEIAKEILGSKGIVFYCVNITSTQFKLRTCKNETYI